MISHEDKSPKTYARATHLGRRKTCIEFNLQKFNYALPHTLTIKPPTHPPSKSPRSELIDLRGPSTLAPPIHISSVTTLSKTKTFDKRLLFSLSIRLVIFFLSFFLSASDRALFSPAPLGIESRRFPRTILCSNKHSDQTPTPSPRVLSIGSSIDYSSRPAPSHFYSPTHSSLAFPRSHPPRYSLLKLDFIKTCPKSIKPRDRVSLAPERLSHN